MLEALASGVVVRASSHGGLSEVCGEADFLKNTDDDDVMTMAESQFFCI